ncbi:Ras-related protein Rab-4B [Trichinella zimbabwensis]|uniref:Ras-related protein Rab-4B n=1 Tax=Trichinella zimbabwensis TaxID=268475 RepID=A0A0V1HHZ8_9BILA|nr:Ras-related protein Rab-4B [Trichinella zimbabwensis]KRZ10054.1 Ras-related protein Rab-4B [Trichinella zimbabwensis]
MPETYNYLFKFLIIGNSGTGKSCVLHQFLENKFKQDTAHTIGIEFGSKVVKIQDRSIKLQVWDTAGQERFRSLTKNYYNGAACALLVYDITCRQSFNAIAQWLSDARSLASPQIIVILIGNKKDLEDRREVTFMEASQFAQENGMLFLETSALSGENIEETFLRCARSILTKIESGGAICPTEVYSFSLQRESTKVTVGNVVRFVVIFCCLFDCLQYQLCSCW